MNRKNLPCLTKSWQPFTVEVCCISFPRFEHLPCFKYGDVVHWATATCNPYVYVIVNDLANYMNHLKILILLLLSHMQRKFLSSMHGSFKFSFENAVKMHDIFSLDALSAPSVAVNTSLICLWSCMQSWQKLDHVKSTGFLKATRCMLQDGYSQKMARNHHSSDVTISE